MSILRITIRLFLIGIHMVAGVLLCIFALPSDWNSVGLPRARGIVQWWLRTCARIIGVRIHAHGVPTPGAALVVSNHISWMDIVIVGGLQQVSFLSKFEIARWPVIGYLARKAGTLFIDRGAGAEAATQMISKRLSAGASVAFFPEGTTSDGTEVRRFHPRLFAAALESSTPVQPVSIAYPRTGVCRKVAGSVHPKAPYPRDAPFLVNALAILGEPYIDAVVHYADCLPGNGDRKQLAEKARAQVITGHNTRWQAATAR